MQILGSYPQYNDNKFDGFTRLSARAARVAAATAQLADSSRRGSRTLVVSGFPHGHGALAGRQGRAAERAPPRRLSSARPARQGARWRPRAVQLAANKIIVGEAAHWW